MKRRLALLLLLLVGGAIVNVAVAWAFAVWEPVPEVSNVIEDADDLRLTWLAPSGWVRERDGWSAIVRLDEHEGFGATYRVAIQTRYPLADTFFIGFLRTYPLAIECCAGIPMRSLQGAWRGEERRPDKVSWWPGSNALPALVEPKAVSGCAVPWLDSSAGSASGRFVPLRPIWPGFAINTVFYAVVLWGLFAGPFVVRRWRRIRRGLCPKCAYDLRGSSGETCPECGAPK